MGWLVVQFLLVILIISWKHLSAPAWIGILMLIQAFLVLADVPADGYSVELGQMESIENRGQVSNIIYILYI